MTYCPDCGVNHHADDVTDDTDVTIVDNTVSPAEVEIARINSQRDIKLAQIAAGVDRDALESEIEALKAELRGYKDGVEAVTETADPEPEPEPVEPATIVMDNDGTDDELPPPPPAAEEPKERKSKPYSILGAYR